MNSMVKAGIRFKATKAVRGRFSEDNDFMEGEKNEGHGFFANNGDEDEEGASENQSVSFLAGLLS